MNGGRINLHDQSYRSVGLRAEQEPPSWPTLTFTLTVHRCIRCH